jgi:methionine-rich copper-binding protein CopC
MKQMHACLRAAVGTLGLVVASAALAHAMLDHAAPRVGSSVRVAPDRIELWFSERLEPAFSTLKVTDSSGRRVDRGDASVDPDDPTHFSVSVPPLARGRYRVVWRVISADTHATAGDFAFEVAP